MTSEADVFVDLPDGRTVPVGHLSVRASEAGMLVSSQFQYTADYLRDPARYSLCPELPLVQGPITATGHRPIAGCFSDSGPDRWGRNLLFAAERRAAKAQGRPLAHMTDLDFIIMVHDETRQGALRYSIDGSPEFVSPARDQVPSLVDLPELVAAARRHAQHRETDTDLDLLTRAGTSMGGARPKTTVRTPDGRLAIAKLPAADDQWNVLAWEATALELARRAGVAVPAFTLHPITPDSAVLVSDRFDRDANGARIGYLSGHTLVEKIPDGIASYTDLVEVVADHSEDPDADSREMFRRVALTLLVNNVDDHMKNHGVLRGSTGWRLSPVFDVNPFPARWPVDSTPLSHDGDTAGRDIGHLLDLSGHFGMDRASAVTIVAEVERATASWADVAADFGIEPGEVEFMSSAFESKNRSIAHDLTTTVRIDTSLGDRPAGTSGWVAAHLRNGRPVRGYPRGT